MMGAWPRTANWRVMVVVVVGATLGGGRPDALAQSDGEAPFKPCLSDWDPVPGHLPSVVRPLDIERPTFREDLAADEAELEAREARDTLRNEAMRLTERMVAVREVHQGEIEKAARWQDSTELQSDAVSIRGRLKIEVSGTTSKREYIDDASSFQDIARAHARSLMLTMYPAAALKTVPRGRCRAALDLLGDPALSLAGSWRLATGVVASPSPCNTSRRKMAALLVLRDSEALLTAERATE